MFGLPVSQDLDKRFAEKLATLLLSQPVLLPRAVAPALNVEAACLGYSCRNVFYRV